MTEDQVKDRLQRELTRAGGQAKWCASHGIPHQRLSDFMCGRRPPTKPILDVLGLVRHEEVYYTRKPPTPESTLPNG